jgi:poly(3-hydroxybutyrate) depolymerase
LSGLAAVGAGTGASRVRVVTFSYRSHAGPVERAYVVLPAWYGPRRHPAIPLVISPHGRGVDGRYNLRFWGAIPTAGPFAVVSPDGHGRRLALYSWGWAGQIDDLARMPALASRALPWLRIDPGRIYAIGDSMGAQEVLLLLARGQPRLAGVAAFDPVTNMAARYHEWLVTPGLRHLRAVARKEFGGTPAARPAAYAARSPLASLEAIGRSGAPLELWWSHRDAVIADQPEDTGAFFSKLMAAFPDAPVQEVVGYWQHGHAMHPETQLPAALACLGLVPGTGVRVPAYTQSGADGPIQELPPDQGGSTVPFTRAFCGRA